MMNHSHALVYDPANGSVTYEYDGQTVHEWDGTSSLGPEVSWGLGSTLGRGSMNYHRVQFDRRGFRAL